MADAIEHLTRERNAAQAIADPYVCDLLSNESSDDGGWRCIDEEPDGLLPEVCYAVGRGLIEQAPDDGRLRFRFTDAGKAFL